MKMADHQSAIDILLGRQEKGENVDSLLKKQFPFYFNAPEIEAWHHDYVDAFMELITERRTENGLIPSSFIRDYARNEMECTPEEYPFFCMCIRAMDNFSIKYAQDNRKRKQQAQSKKDNLKKLRHNAIKESR